MFRDLVATGARKSPFYHAFEHWNQRTASNRVLQIREALVPALGLEQHGHRFSREILGPHVPPPSQNRQIVRPHIYEADGGLTEITAGIERHSKQLSAGETSKTQSDSEAALPPG